MSKVAVIPFRIGDIVRHKTMAAGPGRMFTVMGVDCRDRPSLAWFVRSPLGSWIPADDVEFVRRCELLDSDDYVRPAFVEAKRDEPRPYKLDWAEKEKAIASKMTLEQAYQILDYAKWKDKTWHLASLYDAVTDELIRQDVVSCDLEISYEGGTEAVAIAARLLVEEGGYLGPPWI